MKIKFYLSFLFILVSFINYSQIIEEKKEGDFLIKNHLNSDLEIIKIEKLKDNNIIESFEYLPGGKIKNGKFFKQGLGEGFYENGKIKNGLVLYESTIDYYKNLRFYGNLNITDFKLKGYVELIYDNKKKGDLTYDGKKPEILAKLNFNENGLLDGKQFYNDKKFNYYLEYKNGNPIKYQKKENDIFIDSITFNNDITKNVTYLLNQNVYNRQQPRLIFNPFNYFIQLNDDCYNSTKEYESNYENIINSGYTNDLKNIVINYGIKQDCNNRKISLDGINIIFQTKYSNLVNDISNSNYKFLPNRLLEQSNLIPKNDIASIEYFFISEVLLGRNNHKILSNNLSTDSKEITYNNLNYLNNYFVNDVNSEHTKLSFLLYAITTTGLKAGYTGNIDYGLTAGRNNNSVNDNIDLFENIVYYKNGEEFYKIELKDFLTEKDKYKSTKNFFLEKAKSILSSFPSELLNVSDKNSIKIEEFNWWLSNVTIEKPDVEKVIDYFSKTYKYNKSQESSTQKINDNLYIGKEHLGGIIFHLEQNGTNGLIITKQELGKFTLKEAIQKCKTYSDNGSGWYLPSIEELELVYQNLKAKNIGTFSNDYYWSADEGRNAYFGNAVDFTTGDRTFGDMGIDAELLVIAVKKF